MGNESQSEAIGIGTVKLKMHDGTIVTLTKVRLVPDLTKNFISLGTLEANGCKFLAEDEVLAVIKDGHFVMSTKKSGNLYIL